MKTGNNTKLIQAEALRNARQSNEPFEGYAKRSPGEPWHDGQTAPISPELSERLSTQNIDGQIQIGQNHEATFPATQDGHSQPAQYFSGGEQQPKPAPTCETPGCVKAASNILKEIDEAVDPCDNFYEFACGKYIREAMIPEDKTSLDPYDSLRDLVQEQLRTIINEPPQPNESKPFKLAKNFNLACLNKENIEAQGIKPLADILEAYGGWPVVKGDSWSDATWDWVEVIKKFRRMGLPTALFFLFDINVDLKNSNQRQLYVST